MVHLKKKYKWKHLLGHKNKYIYVLSKHYNDIQKGFGCPLSVLYWITIAVTQADLLWLHCFDGTKASMDSLHVVPFLYITYTLQLYLHSEERCFKLLIMLTLKQLTATYPHHLVIELHNIFYLRETEGSTWGHPRFLVGSVSLIVLDFCIMLFILCVLVPCLAYPMLPMVCPFLIDPLSVSNIYLHVSSK